MTTDRSTTSRLALVTVAAALALSACNQTPARAIRVATKPRTERYRYVDRRI